MRKIALQENIETKESKILCNNLWNDSRYKINIAGKSFSLKDCYDMTIEHSKKIFTNTRKVALKQIPKNKYILYINSTVEGVAKNKDLKYIDKERIEKMYESETGNPKIDPDNFQERNIRYCLGLGEEEKDKLKNINPFKEKIPEDLSDCIGIIFSGSEAYVTDEQDVDRIKMINKEIMLIEKSNKLKIPKLGICFGGQLIANQAGAKIKWITDKNGNKNRITGMNEILKKNRKYYKLLSIDLPEGNFYVAENHGQKIEKENIPTNEKVIAENLDGEVEMVYIEETKTICTQFHPEAGPIRLDIALSLPPNPRDNIDLFTKDMLEIREKLFIGFLKIAGAYAKK